MFLLIYVKNESIFFINFHAIDSLIVMEAYQNQVENPKLTLWIVIA